MYDKFLSKENILKKIKLLKKNNKKIVLCHGVFDLFHVGHIRHLKYAKKQGDILIVSLTADNFVNKGPGKPIFKENLRTELISAISFVDYVIISNSENAIDVIRLIKPKIYCKGIEYKDFDNDITKKIRKEVNEVYKHGGKVCYSNEATFSSSAIINENINVLTNEQNQNIKILKKKFSIQQIEENIQKLKKLSVLVIGEIILDEYIFSEAIGKSAKEPILVLREDRKERYVGGAGSIAKNIFNFCKSVSLISYLGEKKEFNKEIRSYLTKKVKCFFINKNNSCTILKKRYLDIISNSKLLGVYQFNDDLLIDKDEKKINSLLKKQIPLHDLIIVSDYGHGLISKKNAELISRNAKFLTLNAQINAANIGYHSLQNYKKSDCVIINERELRHEFRDRYSDIKILIKKLSRNNKYSYILVTRGASGLILYQKKINSFLETAAFASSVIDKVGAGDIILSIFSLCLRVRMDLELALFLSSIAAAENIKNFANKNIINPNLLIKILTHILK
jgi:rfaE bifunctional protein kinase chain/domain/rfaE bifunctional protein nucleotidyltransferase chain/domain